MGKLIVNRNSEWSNKARNFKIYVNGIEIGKIADGEIKDFELDSGKHQFYAKVDWCKSKIVNFEISESGTKTIELSGFKYGNLIFPISLAIILIYYLSKYILNFEMDFLLAIVGIGFLYLIYHLTFGKNRYINAKELKNEPSNNVLQHRV